MARDARRSPEDRPPAPGLRREAAAELRADRAADLTRTLPIWLDGELCEGAAARVPADDSALVSGLACYTTARVAGGRVRFGARHGARIARDVSALGLGRLDPEAALAAMEAIAVAAFGAGEGIVRLQASQSGAGALRLLGLPREVGREPVAWSAQTAPVVHEGPGPFGGAKLSGHPRIALARAAAERAGCDEALLFDAGGRLVEGARTALVVVCEDGRVVTPPPERGGVASLAIAVARDAIGGLEPGDIGRAELLCAIEIVALNAVRGAVPIARLDGRAVGGGTAGPLAAKLREVLAAAE